MGYFVEEMTCTACFVPFNCFTLAWQLATLCRSCCTRTCSLSTCAVAGAVHDCLTGFPSHTTHPCLHLVKYVCGQAVQLLQSIHQHSH